MANATMAPAPDRNAFSESVKDAALAAVLAGALGFFFLALRTDIAPGGLVMTTRWGLWITSIVIVFAVRLVLNVFVYRTDRPATGAMSQAFSSLAIPGLGKWLGRLLFLFALVLPFFFTYFYPARDRQFIDLAILIMTYIMLGWGLNIVVGLAGLLDLGYVAFYAVGAYSYALLSTQYGWGFWQALPVSGALAASFGILLGYPILRLRGDYLAIVTLGFGEIIRIILVNWTEFSNGPNGISSIPRPSFFGLEFSRRPAAGEQSFAAFFGLDYSPMQRLIFLYYVILVLALATHVFVSRLRRLPVGRAWEALREDEIACRAMGMNTTNIKLSAFAIGAMLGGFAGVFFAARQGFISPESFVFTESAIVLAIVVLGGMGSQMGVVLAATLLVLIPEFGRNFAEYRMLLFGAAMVLIMVWKPGGLLSHREPTLRLGAAAKATEGGR